MDGSPRRIDEYLFEDRPDKSLLRLLRDAGADALVFGHTHQPFWKRLDDPDHPGRELHAIDAGSVGKPKDGDPRACWLLLEVADRVAVPGRPRLDGAFRRVAYDVERAARAIEEGPLPSEYADALREARWSDVGLRPFRGFPDSSGDGRRDASRRTAKDTEP